jgi:Uma2 family endonuclease
MNTPFRPLNAPEKLRLTVDDFCLLDAAGAFADHAKSELIDGTIYVVNAQFSEHMKAKVRLLRRLADVCDAQASGLEAWSEGSVRLGDTSLPEPDIFITRETPQRGAVPGESVALVIEVADTTVEFDTKEKAALYAGAGVPEYWVVDLPAASIHQLWSPEGRSYLQLRKVPLGERVGAQTLPGVTVSTTGLV